MVCNSLKIFCSIVFIASLSFCQSTPSLEVPSFDYRTVSKQYFRSNLKGHFSFTRQDEASLHPISSSTGYLFYTASVDGLGDIWMRDLQSTNTISLIKHPAEQYKPAVNANGSLMAFVSEDRNYKGDVYLLSLDPKELSKRSLQSLATTNLWGDSHNLSLDIEKWAKRNLGPECHGSFAEDDPDFNTKGDQLVFVSDRCTPGSYNIWLAVLDGQELVILQRLTELGGLRPRWNSSGDKLTFISYRNLNTSGRIYILDFKAHPRQEIELNLPQSNNGQAFHYDHPDFVSYENTLVYTSARKDTNQDGLINGQDYSAIYSVSLPDEDQAGKNEDEDTEKIKKRDSTKSLTNSPIFANERQILEPSIVLHGLTYSDTSGGSLFYSANLNQAISIYFMPYEGVIPKEKNIEDQYQLSRHYLRENEGRYLIALEAVEYYFSDQPQYILYEPKILIDRLVYLQNTQKIVQAHRVEATIKEQLSSKPYLKFYYKAHKYGEDSKALLDHILAFYQQHDQKQKIVNDRFYMLPENQQDFILATVLHRLSQEYVKQKKNHQALHYIRLLNTNYTDYPLRGDAISLQADLEFSLDKRISSNLRLAVAQANVNVLERIHSKVYESYTKKPSPELRKHLEQELEKIDDSYHPLLAGSLRLAWAYYLMQDGQYQKALNLCLELQKQIPKSQLYFPYTPEKGWRNFNVNTWLIAQDSYKALGNLQGVFSAIGEVVINYPKKIGVNLWRNIFQEFIDYSKQQIDDYLYVARSLAQTYKNYGLKLEQKKASESSYWAYLPGLDASIFNFDFVFSDTQQEFIQISGAQAQTLISICSSKTQNSFIFRRLDKKRKKNYLDFCQQNMDRLIKKTRIELPLRSVQLGIDSLYALAYMGAKTLNSLFFATRRSKFLPDVYNKDSIYFQRLEVDIAAEQNQRLLEIIPENLYLKFIVGDIDIYNARVFAEIEKEYRLVFGQAVAAEDLSLLYGYAYALIKKNVEREAFYVRLGQRGQAFSASFLRRRKREILQGFKDAEALLTYALNINPLHIDSSLLLGWLHQYIDERKKVKVQYQAAFYKRFAGQKYETDLDQIFYKDIYEVYFPNQYFEKNVELYRQVLRGSQDTSVAPTTLARLYLNLANNHFNLLNFKDAIENYRKVIEIFIDQGRFEFENPKQELLFYFNFARTLIYEAKYQEAISYLQKSYQLYKYGEYLPLKKEYNGLQFTVQSATEHSKYRAKTSRLYKNEKYQKSLLETTARQLTEARIRLALLSALTGFAYWQDGNSKQAVIYYTQADSYLSQKEGEELARVKQPVNLNRENLLNFMAIAYQENKQFNRSDKSAQLAERKARQRGLDRGDDRYQPKTYCGRSLGCILDFGEDFSVVGEGRSPYGFSRLRQVELSTSIQLENMIMQGNLGEASKLIEKQSDLFEEEEGDTKHGRIGYIHTLNRSALLEYEAGNYQAAARLFAKAGNKAESFSDSSYYESNYANSFTSLLTSLEYISSGFNIDDALDVVEEGLEDLEDVKSVYRRKIRQDFISESSLQYFGYQFDEKRDGLALRLLSQQRLVRLTIIEASLLYYKGHFLRSLQEKPNANLLSRTQKYFNRAIQLMVDSIEAMESLEKDKQNNTSNTKNIRALIRARYNLGRLYFASGRLYAARELLEKTVQEAYEFNLIPEEIVSRFLLIHVAQELSSIYGPIKYEKAIDQHINFLTNAFFNNPHYYHVLRYEAQEIANVIATFFLKKKRYSRALQVLETTWAMSLQWNYFHYPVVFGKGEEGLQQELHKNIRENRTKLLALEEEEYRVRSRRENTKKLGEKKQELRIQIVNDLSHLGRVLPTHTAFLFDTGFQEANIQTTPKLGRGQLAMRFFVGSDVMVSWCFSGNSKKEKVFSQSLVSQGIVKEEGDRSFFKTKAKVPYQKKTYQLLRRCVESQGQDTASKSSLGNAGEVQDIFLIIPEQLSNLNFTDLISQVDPQLSRPVFVSRLSDAFLGKGSSAQSFSNYHKAKHIHVFNVASIPKPIKQYVKPAMIQLHSNTISPLQFKKRRSSINVSTHEIKDLFDPGYLLGENKKIAVAVLNNTTSKQLNYSKQALLYEILRSHGVGTLALLSKTGRLKDLQLSAGKQSYTQVARRVFGFTGFDSESFSDFIHKKYELSFAQAVRLERQKKYHKAQENYQLAASYLAWQPQQKSKLRKLSLALMRMEVLLAASVQNIPLIKQDNKIIDHIDRLLSYAAQKSKEDSEAEAFEAKIYTELLATLTILGDELSAKKCLELCLKRFLELEKCQNQEIDALGIQRRLQKNQYGLTVKQRDTFSADFASLYPHLSVQNYPDMIVNLIKHSQYEAANNLLRASEKEFRPQNKDIATNTWQQRFKLISLLDRVLFGLEALPKDLSLVSGHLRSEDLYLQMLFAAWQSEWKKYENLAKNIQSQRDMQKFLWRKNLYDQWRNFLQGYDVDLGFILNSNNLQTLAKSVEKKQEVNFTHNHTKANGQAGISFLLLLLERSLIYHLLVHTLSLDAYSQSAHLLDVFIKEEGKKFSYNRAALMALGAAEKYWLEQDNFDHAYHFFSLYKKLMKTSIPNSETIKQSVRLQFVLEAAGFSKQMANYENEEKKNEKQQTNPSSSYSKQSKDFLGLLLNEVRINRLGIDNLSWQSLNKILQEALSQQYNQEGVFKSIYTALTLLQKKAARANRWEALINISFLKQALRNHEIEITRIAKIPTNNQNFQTTQTAKLYNKNLGYKNWVREIQKKLPAKQSFVGLIDIGDKAFRFMIVSDSLRTYPLDVSGYYLRAHANRYIRSLYRRDGTVRVNAKALTFYRQIPQQGQQNLSYIWLPGVHSLIPLKPRINEKLFQVMNLEKFLSRPILQLGKEFSSDLQTISLGERKFAFKVPNSQINDSYHDQILQAERIYSMEKLGLASLRGQQKRKALQERRPFLSQQNHKIYHLFANLETNNVRSFASKLRRQDGVTKNFWFLSSNFLEKDRKYHVPKYNYTLASLGKQMNAPGVICLHMPIDLGHAYFVRYFYERTKAKQSIVERFTQAYFRTKHSLEKSSSQWNGSFAYRLVTPRLLRIDTGLNPSLP